MTATSGERQRRVCGAKVKTGCQTCRIRRVKCDETKPACKRCTSTGRRCDGYLEDVLTSMLGSNTIGKRLLRSTPILMSGTSEEKRGFRYFTECTAPQLSGYYSSSFWENLILQASANESCVRHAIIAIGALHEEFSSPISQDKTSGQQGETSNIFKFATKQYNKAIQHLRLSLSTSASKHDQQSLLTALLCSLLFISFDSLRSHFHTAMMHFRSGLRILHSLHTSIISASHLSNDIYHLLTDTLTPLFKRLTIQAILYIDTRSLPEQHSFAAELFAYPVPSPPCSYSIASAPSSPSTTPTLSSPFPTLEAARHSLNTTINGIFNISYLCTSSLPISSQPPQIHTMHTQYTSELKIWSHSFASFLNSPTGKTLNKKEIRGATLLKIQHLTVSIIAGSTPTLDDRRELGIAVSANAAGENFRAVFKDIIGLAGGLIDAEGKEEETLCRGMKRMTFSTDLGLVAPLYYVAAKCGDEGIRKQAVDLIARMGRKREGMWDSWMVGRMVKEMGVIERSLEGNGEPGCGGLDKDLIREGLDLVVEDGLRWEWRVRGRLAEVRRLGLGIGGGEGSVLVVDGRFVVVVPAE